MWQLIAGSMGQCKPIANWPMRGLAWHFLQAAVGQFEPIGEDNSLKHGPLQAFPGRDPSCPYRPMQQPCAAAHCVLNWPMQGLA